jgi:hypothetical protein
LQTPRDAIVVFRGGDGERVQLACQLVLDGVATALVLPNGLRRSDARPAIDELSSVEGIIVVTGEPATIDTAGEAAYIAGVAQQRGWSRLLLVTSTYHVPRASVYLRRALAKTDLAVTFERRGAKPTHTPWTAARRWVHEALGLVQSLWKGR